MRVLVTGGAGFIGGAVARRLLDRGASVVVLDDLSGAAAAGVPPGAELIVADVADPQTSERVAELAPDAIVHAAAQVSVARSVDDPARDAAVNVDGTAHVLAGARQAGARRLVFLSSGGAIYGDADGADETTPPAPQSPYGQNKLRAEELVGASGLGHAIARLSNVYGPGQRADLEGGVVAIFSERIAAANPVPIHGDGGQRRDFLHVEDAAAAIEALLDSERDGTWNVSSGSAISIVELLETLESLTGRSVARIAEPARTGDVRVSRLANDRIRAEIGWAPRIQLVEGLAGLIGLRR